MVATEMFTHTRQDENGNGFKEAGFVVVLISKWPPALQLRRIRVLVVVCVVRSRCK